MIKQHITKQQWDELSEDQKKMFLKAFPSMIYIKSKYYKNTR